MEDIPPIESLGTLKKALIDMATFSRKIIGRPLRPYQLSPARAIFDSIRHRNGLSISIMMARQAGKNELSAQLECYLLNAFQMYGGNIVKCAPTFKPQIINSKQRLEQMLQNELNLGEWKGEWSYIVRLGQARCMFFSADDSSNVVGATAHILLEFDEAQDISPQKHDRDFMPMGATTNATKAYYGTAWDEDGLLELVKQKNLEMERKDGLQRHFEYPWWVVAEHNPLYAAYVQGERARLGDVHPLFRTQYKLETIAGVAGFLSAQQRAQMAGSHPRCRRPAEVTWPEGELVFVAGVDVAGKDEEAADAQLRAVKPRRDSTVVTIGRLDFSLVSDLVLEPRIEVVEHYYWTGRSHREQYEALLDVLRSVWGCGRVVVDATGIGAGVADFLMAALGDDVVEPFVFTMPSKSRLGYKLLAAINSGRFKMYAADGSEECQEFWTQCERARYRIGANQTLSFYVPEADGHDDFLISAALVVQAAAGYGIAPAGEVAMRPVEYEDGRY
ncbi:MAG: hypothetical protein HY675_02785 [Chloroflexi bacterium]|nr:hypothetical protein [Chloroflexota bacterium]